MVTGDEPPLLTRARPTRRSVRSWLVSRPVQQYAYAAGALLLLVTGLFGGLGKVDPREQPLTAGATLSAAPLTVVVSRASTTSDLGSVGKSERGRFVSIVGTVHNDTDATVGLDVLRAVVKLTGVPDVYQTSSGTAVGMSDTARPWGVYVVADSTLITSVGPGLTYEVVWIYEQQATSPPPASVGVTVQAHTLRANTVDQQIQWLDAAAVATGTLPLKVVPPA